MAETATPPSRRHTPTVSIILPTYNRAHWLRRAIDSCLTQTLRDIELIVVDDGSQDHTAEVARNYEQQDARVRYVHQQNGKLPAALNTGHRAATGRYLTWTSDDNCFEESALEIMVGYLEQYATVGLVYCNQKLVDRDGNVLRLHRHPSPDRIWHGSCVGACFLYRRQVYETIGPYDTDLFLAEDYDYWLRISRKFQIAHLADVFPYRATCHDKSLTERHRATIDWQCARARAKNAGSWWRARRFLGQGHLELGYNLRCQRRWRESVSHCLRSIAYWPLDMLSYRGLCGALLRRSGGED